MEKKSFGARVHNNGDCTFRIFAPHIQSAEITVNNSSRQTIKLIPDEYGFHEATLKKIRPGISYSYSLDEFSKIPDPASLWQPLGLKNSSVIIDHHFFDWKEDNFSGLPMRKMVIYEAHVGAFSVEQSFSGITSRLDHLKDLGINTLQLMPVAQFTGQRGWGYETVFPYAVHSSYGSPDELKELVRQCHLNGIAVIFDVAFGSLTPINKLEPVYFPFFSEKYNSTQGRALNFDEKYSYGVREFYIQCALSWLDDYHIDGLRINDAHAIFDQSPVHFLEELSTRIKEFSKQNNRVCVLITGDKRNALRPVLPLNKGGYDLDALYNDNFHNALQSRLTGDTQGHLKDYSTPERMVSAMQYGFAYRGELSSYYQRLQGSSNSELRGCKFVVYSQGHDPDSSYLDKYRIIQKAGFEAAKLAAGATLLSPYIPMIFMGEEYGEPAPFNFFADAKTSYSPRIWKDSPVPNAQTTFSECQLNWHNIKTGQGRSMLALYKRILKARREHQALHEPCRSRCQVQEISPGLVLIIRNSTSNIRKYAAILLNFNQTTTTCHLSCELPEGIWTTEIYSASATYGGRADPLPTIISGKEKLELAPQSFALFFYTEVNI
ncbi:alpha-amylase family glycosyl hydrolase [Maridesulfovibrio hydrothermalis]|uniref:Malto-oligosyltrehalose trehalohydrolase n=1 Tax=Maridesulfovibrio hydrothermalis AM13 = DSM 14728 TaxID=1121451 RepID=L0RF13_9BACT|nr:alpha-amylase family glycosyl hydrolase [Maridesulfovibrio hydrothermalis]CCO25344.1 Alpha amylase catalytic region [Maridesulfovibrio hydrothermalis AM13 = DSM 14728]